MAKTTPKVVLVTGASSGIGKVTASHLLSLGYLVYVAARRVESMRDLESQGAKVIGMDITKTQDVQAAVARIEQEQGRLDVLVNNAGFGLYGAVEDVPIDDARYQFEVNIFGLAALTQAVLPLMRKQGSGRIVNISSMGGKIYMPLGAWYHSTKHCLEGWSDCLRVELAPKNIQVVIVEPGLIDTGFGEVMEKPLMGYSGQGAYAKLAKSVLENTKASYGEGKASSPMVIAKTVAQAIAAKRPKTRYVAGKMARLMIFMRTFFGDRIFDAMLGTQFKS